MGAPPARRTGFVLAAAGTWIAIGACAALRWEPLGPRRTAAIEGSQAVGADECGVCHEDVQGHERIASYHSGCESCHGPGSLHAETEEAADIRFPPNDDCLACHAPGYSTHLQWGTGDHSRAGLLCSDCHNPHATTRRHLRERSQAAFPNLDAPSALCIECHRDVASQLTFPSHHPVPEGALSCLSCHDPHEDRRVSFGDRNQICSTCHQDFIGPWVFEHPPVVDDCTTCHNPHGAVGANLLETLQPMICLSCHSLNDLWHHDVPGTGIAGDPVLGLPPNTTITRDNPTPAGAPGEVIKEAEALSFLRQCTNCHGAIHGSYTDEHLRH